MARGRHPTRIHIDPPDAQTAAKYLHCWNGRDLRHELQRFPALTSPEMFGNDQPLEIDFGCGNGILACGRAKQYSGINVLGIDMSHKPIYCAVHAAAALKIDNVKFLRGDFHAMLPLLRPRTINAAFYLFPNPPQDYHRERANATRRLFFQNLDSALIPGGRIYFATDAPSFFKCVYDIIENELHFKTIDTENDDTDMLTRYRQLWKEQGRTVWSLVVQKK